MTHYTRWAKREPNSRKDRNVRVGRQSIGSSRIENFGATDQREDVQMKTERLIDLLSTNLEPVKGKEIGRTLAWAIAIGAITAFVVMLATVGLRTKTGAGFDIPFLLLKLLFMVSVIGLGAGLLTRLLRPGQQAGRLLGLILLPFVVMGVACLVVLSLGQPAAWGPMILGTQWAMCLLCIPLFAVVPFGLLVWALRKGAPTNLRRTGAVAGLVAGALGAVAYAFHCPDDSVPFIALWYGAMVGLCALVGAALGPRLLRW